MDVTKEMKNLLLLEGYLIGEFLDTGEIWAFRRRPECFPYDYDWFCFIEEGERWKFGIQIKRGILFTTA